MKALSVLTLGLIALVSNSAHAIDCDKSENGEQLCISLPDEAPQTKKVELLQASDKADEKSDERSSGQSADRQLLLGEASGGALTNENDLHLFSSSNSINSSEIDLNNASLASLSDAERAQAQLAAIDLFLRSPNLRILGSANVTTSSKH